MSTFMSMFPNDYGALDSYQETYRRNLERIRELTQIPDRMVHARNMYAKMWSSYPNSEPWWPSSLEKPPPADPEKGLKSWDSTKKVPVSDYAWRKLSTRVSFPKHMLEGKGRTRLLNARMHKEVAAFKQKMRVLMGPYADDPEAHTGIVARTEDHEDTRDVLLQTTLRVKMPESKKQEAYDVAFHTAIKNYVPGMVDSLFKPRSFLVDFAASWAKKKEDGWMNGITTRKAADFVFEVMALETPMQWEEVKAVPGALFELPKVIVPAHTVTAKDLNTAKKECWARASKVEGVDVKRVEVLARPFLG